MSLDTTVEKETFASVIAGLVQNGLTFDCTITGKKVVIKLTGGF